MARLCTANGGADLSLASLLEARILARVASAMARSALEPPAKRKLEAEERVQLSEERTVIDTIACLGSIHAAIRGSLGCTISHITTTAGKEIFSTEHMFV